MPKKVVQTKRASGVRLAFFLCFLLGQKMGVGGVFAGISPVLGRFALEGDNREENRERERERERARARERERGEQRKGRGRGRERERERE